MVNKQPIWLANKFVFTKLVHRMDACLCLSWQKHFPKPIFLRCYLTRTHVENYNYTMTRHDDCIAWLRKSPFGWQELPPRVTQVGKILETACCATTMLLHLSTSISTITQHLCLFLVPFEATMGCYSMWNSAANVNIIMLEWTCLSTYKREFNRRRWFKTTIGMKISQSMQPAPSYSAILALHLSTDRHFDALAYTIAFRNILQRKHAFR